MVFNMALKMKHYLTIVLVIACSIVFVCPAYANTNSTEGYYSVNGSFTEDGINYEYTDLVYEDGSIYSELYVVEADGSKTLSDSFTITNNDIDEIYLNGELAATIDPSQDLSEMEIVPYDMFPYRHAEGPITSLNPLTSTPFQLMVASEIIDQKVPNVFFVADYRLETFPSDVPPEYFGAITKTEYWIDIYKGGYFNPQNQVGDTIHGFSYGMPN